MRDLYLIALGRQPAQTEIARALAFVDRYAPPPLSNDEAAVKSAWQALCRVIMSSNEFLYVE